MSTSENKLDFLSYELKPGNPSAFLEKLLPVENNKSIHFIGLGGIGMSGIAKIFAELDFKISGSDIKDSPTLYSMAERGATVYIGHDAKNIFEAGLIVVSTAIDRENPEIVEAIKNNIPIVHRAQMLSLLVSGKVKGQNEHHVSIGVTGTHGKTTTSGMIGMLFENAQLKPTIVVGGQMPILNTNSKLGSGQYFIAELDESDGTIVLYSPDITIITNLELDHPDHYKGGLDQLLNTFVTYINNLDDNSTVLINLDSEGNRKLIELLPHKNSKLLTYSINSNAPYFKDARFKAVDIYEEGFSSSFKILYENEPFGDVNLIVPGMHNVSNALAAAAVGIESGLGLEKVLSSICKFSGMKRRFQVVGQVNGAKIVDDYAHHPTEIQATLATAQGITKAQGKGRVIAVFQPHRYSRLSTFWNEFTTCFKDADVVYVCDVYSANEKLIENVNSKRLAECIKHDKVEYIGGSIETVAEKIYDYFKPGDLVLTIGAGSITKLGNILIEKMERIA